MHSQLNSSMADLHPGAVTITESPTKSPRASIASHALQILVWLVIHLIHPSNPLDLLQVGKNEHAMTGRSRISLEMDPMCGPSWEPSFRTRASIHQGALATCAQHWKANLKQLELKRFDEAMGATMLVSERLPLLEAIGKSLTSQKLRSQ